MYLSYWAHEYPSPWWLQFGSKQPSIVHEALKALKANARFPYIVGPVDYGPTIVAVPPLLGVVADDAARSIADFVTLVSQSLPALTEPASASQPEPVPEGDSLES